MLLEVFFDQCLFNVCVCLQSVFERCFFIMVVEGVFVFACTLNAVKVFFKVVFEWVLKGVLRV